MDRSQLMVAFFVSLGVTVGILGFALVMAKLHKQKAHIGGIAAFLVTLLVTLYFAETLGTHYDFQPLSYWIHLPLACVTTLFTIGPLVTGFRFWKAKGKLQTHKNLVGVWLVLVVGTLGTGGWMLWAGTPIAQVQVEDPGSPQPPGGG